MYVGLWSRLAALGWVAILVGCHAPGNELETVRYGPDDRVSESYTVAKINITYVDEHGKFHSETSEIGKYGQGFVGNAKGVAVHIRAKGSNGEQNHWACSWPLLSTAQNGTFPDEPWIALIKRGNCSFEDKVQNAFKAGAAAVLVYNDKDSIILDKMSLSGTRNISAVFTYKWKGEEIARLVDNGTRVMIGIIKGRTTLVNSNNINKTSVLFVSISFIVLMVISLAWLVFYYIQRFRYIHAKDRLSKRLCCAAKKALSKIPVRSLKTDDREIQGDGECCAICIEPYKVSENLRSLPCRHEFHKHCIDPWLLEHRTCPMCKMDILKYYGFVFTGSQESILQLEIEEARSRTISPARNRHITLLTSDNSYEEAGSERSSRASSPDELVPSLRTCETSSTPQRTNNRSHTPTSAEQRQETSNSDPMPSASPHE